MSGLDVTVYHDSIFKWLLNAFLPEFFAHYFPEIAVREIHTADKEFLKKLESFKDSIEADMLITLEAEIDGKWHSVVVCLEHKSWRTEVEMTVMEYAACSWLVKKKPVWSIVFFTDEGHWRADISDRHWFGFSKAGGQMMYVYDIIKINREKSADLIAKKSLFLSLLALRANREHIENAEIVKAVYRDAANLGELLSNDQKLLIEQMVEAYSKLTPQVVHEIKERQTMRFVANTITEHYEHIGELRGEARGEVRGELRGELRGALTSNITIARMHLERMEALLDSGLLSQQAYAALAAPLQKELAAAEAQLQELDAPRHAQSA